MKKNVGEEKIGEVLATATGGKKKNKNKKHSQIPKLLKSHMGTYCFVN